MKKTKIIAWCRNCWQAGMKSISFQAVRNGNGYVRPSYSGEGTEAGRPGKRGLLVAGALLALTATFVALMLLGW